MTEWERQPGASGDPDRLRGTDPEQQPLPPGDTAGDTGGPGEPSAAELDLPGPDDPVAWNYVEPGTEVVGPDGERLGTVAAMLGTETEGIFHGVAVAPESGGPTRVIPADAVTHLTPSRVAVTHSRSELQAAEVHAPPER